MLLDTHLGGLEESKKIHLKKYPLLWDISTINSIFIKKLIQIS
jgi:hypothetical protein